MNSANFDFPLESLIPTLRRMTAHEVPHAQRFLRLIENNPDMTWAELHHTDQAIIQSWSLHLVGLLANLNDQLKRIREVVTGAAEIERNSCFLSQVDLLRLAVHHEEQGDEDRANAFRLAAAMRMGVRPATHGTTG